MRMCGKIIVLFLRIFELVKILNNFFFVIFNKISIINMGLLCNMIDIWLDYNVIDI